MAHKTIGAWIRGALGGHGGVAQQKVGGASPHIGRQVITSDGIVLGTVTTAWQGADATDRAPHEDTLGVRRSDHDVEGLLYIPSHAIARLSDQGVMLTVDEAQVTARGWRYRPGWLPQEARGEATPGTTV